MSENFINNNRLVTLSELQYLLLEVLDRKQPISWDDLSRICKEKSFNFAFAFENTISFLQLISVIKVNENRLVTRNSDDGFEILKTEHALPAYILSKTFSYLLASGLLKLVINAETLSRDISGEVLTLHINKISPDFIFIKSLVLNLKIAESSRVSNNELVICRQYKNLFEEKLVEITKPISDRRLKFFISYAHKDEAYKEELRNHLSGIIRKDGIEEWNGRAIQAGEDWDDEIRKKLEEADVVLFLVSSDFMASDYINDVELSKTIERHKNGSVKIIPVILRSCDFTSLPIGKYQALPSGGIPISDWPDKDKAYLDVVKQIKKTFKLK